MRRPRLAPPFTVMTDAESVWLVAGEDVRYRLRTIDPAALRDVLAKCDGTRTLDQLAASADTRATLERLYEERVLVDGTAAAAHEPIAGYRVVGTGALADALRTHTPRTDMPRTDMPPDLPRTDMPPDMKRVDMAHVDTARDMSRARDVEVFAQDNLDFRALMATNREALASRRRWMWITTGPGGRAYVGPLFVPHAGPCAACLLVHFKRLSPVPELYDVVLAHDGAIAPSNIPEAAITLTAALATWKLSLGREVAALYKLHVVEVADLTITAHAPLVDLECTECR